MQRHLLLAIGATLISFSTVWARPFTLYQEEQERIALGAQEDCGPQPEPPSILGSIFNDSQKKAAANYYACLDRNKRRDYLKQKAEMEAIVDRARNSCQNAIRGLSSTPSTLSFEYGKDFAFISGLNGSGVDTTDGGYSVKVNGSDIGGSFQVTCYMDRSFRITHVRNDLAPGFRIP